MPHLVIQYTPNLTVDMDGLCAALAEVIAGQRGADGSLPFPLAGTRVLAFSAAQFAVADLGQGGAFLYLNLRIAPGRSADTIARLGEALQVRVRQLCADALGAQALGITLQIDEGREVFDAKLGNLHQRYASSQTSAQGPDAQR